MEKANEIMSEKLTREEMEYFNTLAISVGLDYIITYSLIR